MVIGVESPICIHALYEDVGSENTRVDLAAQFIRMCSCLSFNSRIQCFYSDGRCIIIVKKEVCFNTRFKMNFMMYINIINFDIFVQRVLYIQIYLRTNCLLLKC